MNSTKIGVVGAGVMGAGIALALARSGFEVRLMDLDEDIVKNALDRARAELRLSRLFGRSGDLQENHVAVLSRIKSQVDFNGFESLPFVIESVTELLPIKSLVFKDLATVCNPQCVIASNTSAIPISQLASFSKLPENVVGIHFMNPVTMGDSVEIIRGLLTSQFALDSSKSILTKMGKKWIEVNDGPGFVTNRVLMITINEAIHVLHEKKATATEIDSLFRSCFGHRMGPLETADLIGLDTILNSIMVLYESFNDSKFRPSFLLKQMVHSNMLGRKTGKGFYSY